MKVIYKKEVFQEHDWYRNDDGSIDEFAMAHDFCNGPACKRCHHSFCVHCHPDGYNDKEPCVVEEWKCPSCNKPLLRYEKANFCSNCGQKLEWE